MVDRDAFCPINSTDNCIIVPRKARSEDLQGEVRGFAGGAFRGRLHDDDYADL